MLQGGTASGCRRSTSHLCPSSLRLSSLFLGAAEAWWSDDPNLEVGQSVNPAGSDWLDREGCGSALQGHAGCFGTQTVTEEGLANEQMDIATPSYLSG